MSSNWTELLKSSPTGSRVLEQERLIVEVTETIAALLRERSMSRRELATRIGKTPAFVTKMLRGTNNFTLRTLSDVLFALDRSAHFSIGEIGEGAEMCTRERVAPLQLDASAWGRSRTQWVQPKPSFCKIHRTSEGIAA